MSTHSGMGSGIERLLSDVLAASAPSSAPDRLLPETLRAARRVHRWPRWLAFVKEPPMRISSRVAVGSPTVRVALLAASLVLLVAVATAVVVAGASLLPSPSVPPEGGGPRNGLITFDPDGEIMVAEPDGTNLKTLIGGPDVDTGPVFSWDGQQLAFWSQEGSGSAVRLGVADADGTDPRYLDPPDGVSLSGYTGGHRKIEWASDGQRLALLTTDGRIAIADLSDGSWSLLDTGGLEVSAFDGTDDGTRIAFASSGDLFVLDLGSAPVPALSGSGNPIDYASLEWSPSGDRLAYTKARPDPDDPITNLFDAYVLDVAAGSKSRIASGVFFWPAWSPDGSEVALDGWLAPVPKPVGSSSPDLVVASAGGSSQRLLPSDGAEDISWAPDGKWLLLNTCIAAGCPNGVDGVRLIDSAGDGSPIDLPAPGIVGGPSWQRVP